MGMFNEVHAKCPDCGTTNEIQIPQVVLGFGDFYLDIPRTMEDLTQEQKVELAEYVNGKDFCCTFCERYYSAEVQVAEPNRKKYVI